MVMKKGLFLCVIFLLGAVGAVGQNDFRERAKERTEKYVKELKLDEKKAESFRKILDEATQKMREEREKIRSAGNQNREAMREAFTKINDERDKEIKKVLSEEEYKKYQELLSKEQREPRGPRNR
jgi:hypothetical protein